MCVSYSSKYLYPDNTQKKKENFENVGYQLKISLTTLQKNFKIMFEQ